MKTDEEIYAFCRGHYYCDDKGEEDGDVLCEAWEDSSEEDVEEQIRSDVTSLKEFLKEEPEKELSELSDEELSALNEEARQTMDEK